MTVSGDAPDHLATDARGAEPVLGLGLEPQNRRLLDFQEFCFLVQTETLT